MMRVWVFALLSFACLVVESRPPPSVRDDKHKDEKTKEWDSGLEYNKYLQEVVKLLESDPEFRKKLENATEEQIKSGDVAHQLSFADHHVRTKLNEAKLKEVARLRQLANQRRNAEGGNPNIPIHLDFEDMAKFGVADLKKLIQATAKDLDELDKQRKDDFKRYEMEKKYEEGERLSHIQDEKARKAEEARLAEEHKKHRDHKKVKRPMSKDQLEDVWEEEDHMRPEDFDPKTFFAQHDLDGNGLLDESELKALFALDVKEAYNPENKEDDMVERDEELERMREDVINRFDGDKDKMISMDEFIKLTSDKGFEEDEGWNTIDEDEIFTGEEFHNFEAQRQEEIDKMLAQGIVPPGYPYYQGGLPDGAVPYHIPPPPPPGSIPGQPAYNPNNPPPYPGERAYHPNNPPPYPEGQQPPQGYPQGQQQQFQQPPQGQPQFRQPPQGYPQGQPQGQQPPQGQPQGQQPQFQQPPQGQPQFQQPPHGQPQFQQPPQGQPQFQPPPQGQPQGQQPPQGQPQGQRQFQQPPPSNQGQNPPQQRP